MKNKSNDWIYATTRGKYPATFAFHTKIQSKVENAMYLMGHGVNDFYLSHDKENKFPTVVSFKDKHGFSISIKAK
jgi:hypothetical protein